MEPHASNEGTIKAPNGKAPGATKTSCNASSTFNFTVGAAAILAAMAIGYSVYVRFIAST